MLQSSDFGLHPATQKLLENEKMDLVVYAEYRCREYLKENYPDKKFLKTFPDHKFKQVVDYIACGKSLDKLKFLLWRLTDKAGHQQWQSEYAKRYYSNPKNQKRNWFNQIKNRAKKKKFEFDLTLADIDIPEYCPLLGIRLEFGGNNRDNSPSIDRLDPSEGYTVDNTWIISYRANRIKNDATLLELVTLTENLKKEIFTRKHITQGIPSK